MPKGKLCLITMLKHFFFKLFLKVLKFFSTKRELIGGLDIIKELVQSGEFKNVMPESEASLDER